MCLDVCISWLISETVIEIPWPQIRPNNYSCPSALLKQRNHYSLDGVTVRQSIPRTKNGSKILQTSEAMKSTVDETDVDGDLLSILRGLPILILQVRARVEMRLIPQLSSLIASRVPPTCNKSIINVLPLSINHIQSTTNFSLPRNFPD